MFRFGKKKNESTDVKEIKEKDTRTLDLTQRAFMMMLPGAYAGLIKRVEKKWGRKPTFEECKESLYKNPDGIKAAKDIGIDEEQLVEVLEAQYKKMFKE